MSKQRRAPAPILSPQHFALAQSLPHSGISTTSSCFLTPPVSGTANMSPPPRQEAHDYMNVYVPDRHHPKKQHPRERKRKAHSIRGMSEGSRPPPRKLRLGPQAASSAGSDCEICDASVSNGDEDSASNAPLMKNSDRPRLRNHFRKLPNATEDDVVYAQPWPALNSGIIAVDEPDSPAVHALRSLSLQVPTRTNSQGLQRVSTALANSFNRLRSSPTVSFAAAPSRKVSKKAEEASRRSSTHINGLAYRDTNCPQPALKDGKDVLQTLETPATITLRKASNVYPTSPTKTSMSASLNREYGQKRAADAPASELLAFYSLQKTDKRSKPTDISSPESGETPGSPKEQPMFALGMEHESVRRGSKSVSRFSDISNARRYSMPAEAALTFSDVHVAPGSFAVGPEPSKQPLAPADFSRRISTVHFLSRDSVHEVIWREDETTSDSSLTASSRASQHVRRSLRSTPSPESEGSPTREPTIEPKEAKLSLPKVSGSLAMFSRIPDRLFQWSWGASSASAESTLQTADPQGDPLGHTSTATARVADVESDPLGQVLVTSTSNPNFGNLQLSSDERSSRSHTSSISKLPSVQSFPPLRSRSSTAEWRKEPLVDLNDPLAGRVTQHQVQKTIHSVGLRTDVGSSVEGGKERPSSCLHDTAGDKRWSLSPHSGTRLDLVGGEGSGIGASSHKRILARRNFEPNYNIGV